ncbi:MAG: GNAT family N-acetyltransferase [Clostridia bacterium]|nr:GNAT family N-acetyltransferase [Clostridia bacterium]
MDITLLSPSLDHKKSALIFKNEFNNYDFSVAGLCGLEKTDNYEEWLKILEQRKTKETLPQDKVPTFVYFAIRKKDNKIIGIVAIRPNLNEFLTKYAGHIGFIVSPKERQKGYGKIITKLAIEKCKEFKIDEIIITCKKTNTISARCILACGGKLIEEIPWIDKIQIQQRYIIK